MTRVSLLLVAETTIKAMLVFPIADIKKFRCIPCFAVRKELVAHGGFRIYVKADQLVKPYERTGTQPYLVSIGYTKRQKLR
jgi:glycine cleavage system aminomethyltransferase T